MLGTFPTGFLFSIHTQNQQGVYFCCSAYQFFNKQMSKSTEWIFDIFEVYSKIVKN